MGSPFVSKFSGSEEFYIFTDPWIIGYTSHLIKYSKLSTASQATSISGRDEEQETDKITSNSE